MWEHGCAADMSFVVKHDVSGRAALYHFKFVDVGGCLWVPYAVGIFYDWTYQCCVS